MRLLVGCEPWVKEYLQEQNPSVSQIHNPCQIRGKDGVRVLGGVRVLAWVLVRVQGGVWVRVLGAGRKSAMGEGISAGTEPICE